MFPSGHEILIPQPATFAHFADLFTQAGQDTRSYGVPVPDRDGLLFVTVLGVGSVAIVVDMLTVVIRKPALAGLPMLAIYSVPVAVYVDSVPVLPFIVGAVGFLWLLVSDNVDRVRRFGRRFTGDGRDVDVWEPSPLAAAGRRLGAVGVAAAVLLPLLVPTITGGLLSQLTQSGAGVGPGGTGNGAGGKVNLFASLSGQLQENRDGQPGPAHHQRAGPVLPALRRRRPAHHPRLRQPPDERQLAQPRPARPARRHGRRRTSPVPRHGRDHRRPAAGPAAGLLEHAPDRRPRRRLVLRPQPAGRLLQPEQHQGEEVRVRLRAGQLHAGRAAHRRAAGEDQPDAHAVHDHPARHRGRRQGRRADQGQDHRVRQGPRALRLLLQGQRLQLQPVHRSRRATARTSPPS